MCIRPTVSIESFRSRAELLTYLESTGSIFTLLGEDVKVQNNFLCLKVQSGDSFLYVGILSLGSGIQPSWVLVDDHLLVGYNEQVAVFSIVDLALRVVINLLSLFFEFVTNPSLPQIYVLCETAVVAISSRGEVTWRIDTDVICDHRIENGIIALHLMDEPPVRIDLRSGEKMA